MTRLQQSLKRLAPYLFFIGIALVVAACAPGATGPGGSGGPTPTPSQAPLTPSSPDHVVVQGRVALGGLIPGQFLIVQPLPRIGRQPASQVSVAAKKRPSGEGAIVR